LKRLIACLSIILLFLVAGFSVNAAVPVESPLQSEFSVEGATLNVWKSDVKSKDALIDGYTVQLGSMPTGFKLLKEATKLDFGSLTLESDPYYLTWRDYSESFINLTSYDVGNFYTDDATQCNLTSTVSSRSVAIGSSDTLLVANLDLNDNSGAAVTCAQTFRQDWAWDNGDGDYADNGDYEYLPLSKDVFVHVIGELAATNPNITAEVKFVFTTTTTGSFYNVSVLWKSANYIPDAVGSIFPDDTMLYDLDETNFDKAGWYFNNTQKTAGFQHSVAGDSSDVLSMTLPIAEIIEESGISVNIKGIDAVEITLTGVSGSSAVDNTFNLYSLSIHEDIPALTDANDNDDDFSWFTAVTSASYCKDSNYGIASTCYLPQPLYDDTDFLMSDYDSDLVVLTDSMELQAELNDDFDSLVYIRKATFTGTFGFNPTTDTFSSVLVEPNKYLTTETMGWDLKGIADFNDFTDVLTYSDMFYNATMRDTVLWDDYEWGNNLMSFVYEDIPQFDVFLSEWDESWVVDRSEVQYDIANPSNNHGDTYSLVAQYYTLGDWSGLEVGATTVATTQVGGGAAAAEDDGGITYNEFLIYGGLAIVLTGTVAWIISRKGK
jgi:hypothetical protein